MKKNLKFLMLSITLLILPGCQLMQQKSTVGSNDLKNNRIITVDACDYNGNRQALVKVDIGYGDRTYFAYTNSNKQLVRVEAAELKEQVKTEPLTSKGRYCKDEAKVPGTNQKDYDEGHVIADSLGGVSNAYNITPQNSKLNRTGTQYVIEEELRQALRNGKKITEFVAVIEYPDNKTQIPNKYKIEFKKNGKLATYSFENKG